MDDLDDLLDQRFEPDRVYRVVFDVESGQPLAPIQQLAHGELPVALGKLYEAELWQRRAPSKTKVVELTGLEHVKRARGVRRRCRGRLG